MPYTSKMLNDLEYSTENFPSVVVNDSSVQTLSQAEQ